jgi:hypothetical protein
MQKGAGNGALLFWMFTNLRELCDAKSSELKCHIKQHNAAFLQPSADVADAKCSLMTLL